MQTTKLNSAFLNTKNSYKFFWWLSIIDIVYFEKQQQISFEEIIFKILCKLWYPINYFKLSLGTQDQCSKYISEIKDCFKLKENLEEEEIKDFLYKNKNSKALKEIVQKLSLYVPYRFIRPWYEKNIRGVKDSLINAKILSLQDDNCPYKIVRNQEKIIINSSWFEWIEKNYQLIKFFTLFKLIKYLEAKNPGIANISKKIEKPVKRSLASQKKYWNQFIIKNPFEKDVFETKNLINLEKKSLDHFLPWSFVGHDLIWNLHPVNKHINSSKNNFLPNTKYFDPFFLLQYKFCVFCVEEDKNGLLGDYFNLFKCSHEELTVMSKEKFKDNMQKYYLPQIEIAKNMGFQYDWAL